MPDSEILTRFTDRLVEDRLAAESGLEGTSCEDLRSFGWLRGIRETAPMLELRKKNGNIVAIGYAWVERVEFDPSEGIFLDIGDQRILIRGRNLNAEVRPGVRLFEGVTRHRVPWVRELDPLRFPDLDDDDCIIEAIQW